MTDTILHLSRSPSPCLLLLPSQPYNYHITAGLTVSKHNGSEVSSEARSKVADKLVTI